MNPVCRAQKSLRKGDSTDCASRRSRRRTEPRRRSAADHAKHQAGACLLMNPMRIRLAMHRLFARLFGFFRGHPGAWRGRVDRDRGAGGFATLTCHFFQLLALGVSSLAGGVIELRCKARLILAVGFAALRQSCPMTTVIVMEALAAITGAADVKDDAAPWSSTYSLADLDLRQDGRAFPKAGLDNGHQSWQAVDRLTGWFP